MGFFLWWGWVLSVRVDGKNVWQLTVWDCGPVGLLLLCNE